MLKLILASFMFIQAHAEVPKSKIVDLTLEIEESVGEQNRKVLANIKAELNKPFSYASNDLELYGEYVLNEENGKMVLNSRPRKLINGEYIGGEVKSLLGEKAAIKSEGKDGKAVSFSVRAVEVN